jgi:hypothetical protein
MNVLTMLTLFLFFHCPCKDIEIDLIGKGVDDLHDLAKIANEEVRLQAAMIDVSNVNAKLKVTLEEARKADKICIVRKTHELVLFYY